MDEDNQSWEFWLMKAGNLMTMMKVGDSSKTTKVEDREDNTEGWKFFQSDDDEG